MAPTAPLVAAPAATTGPRRAVTRLAVRQVRRGATIVTVVAGAMSAVVVATYEGVIAGAPGGAASLTALAANPAIRTLFGAPVALDDAGGFTVWRLGTVLTVLVGTWAALTAVRVLRGEEDTGRWDLLLAGRVPATAAVSRHLAVLVTAVLVVGAAVTAALLAAGTDPTGAVVHGGSIALVGAFFVGVGGLTAQLWPSRGPAAGAAVAVLVAGLLARMVADGVETLGWLGWLSPFGLVAMARPYDTDRVLPLAVLAAAALVVLVVAVGTAGRRDVRGGVRPTRVRRSRTALLRSLPGSAVRATLRPLAGWAVGIGAFFLLIGLIAESMTRFLLDNPQFADLARQAGFELDAVQGYAATLFALLAVPLGGFTATRIAALAHAETTRRLDLLLGAPITRLRLLAVEAGTAAGGALALTATAGVAVWAGTSLTGAPLGLGAASAGAANTLPITALGLAFALLALGWAPRAVVAVGMVPAAGGFLLTVLADSVDAPAWVAALSPFTHLAPVPAAPPDVPAAVAMSVVAVGVAVLAALGYQRRDIRGD
ncbi:polyketide antibiotic transporter [Pseudonocardia sp. S2-4]|uniref:Polyketide antibiotic transporter n=1 Tax=Pseudonocardia humida TaxID=2800819 RepID=A0ABT1AEH6_9PSEU|nr:polyketide antibiotic transporter [Pseudonocardia humida]